MKKVLISAFLFFYGGISFASTEVSRFAEKQYALKYKSEKAHIVVKKEHVTEYPQVLGESTFGAISYGYGDMKIKKRKKFRVTYVCLLDKNYKPVWSCVIPIK